MAKTTGIEWADSTWNPWRGCKKVSAGCAKCYAERDMKRFGHDFTVPTRSKTTFGDPLKWKEPRVIFVCSWSDFFWEEVPPAWRREAWEVMRQCPQHQFLLLTKRPQNISEMLPRPSLFEEANWPFSNVWLGTSAEDQRRYDERILHLLKVPAVAHFLSAEPLLGPINLGLLGTLPKNVAPRYTMVYERLQWVITGGESALANPRPMKSDWVRGIREQCEEAEIAFFHKQHGGTRKIDGAWGGRELDSRTHDAFPDIGKLR